MAAVFNWTLLDALRESILLVRSESRKAHEYAFVSLASVCR